MAHRRPKADLDKLQKAIGYTFIQIDYLKQALTHRSYNSVNNERLEFLGDALLETISSAYLFKRHPLLAEGDLTRLRSSIVKGSSLAQIAQSLNLGDYLNLGDGELKSGGQRRESILADAVEAIIAAVYLDSDYHCCQQFTLLLFQKIIDNLPNINDLKDPKTQLQEYLQGRNLPLPEYQLKSSSGPEHNRQFTIEVMSQGKRFSATASSRKKAEQAAAEHLLMLYQEQK